MIKKGNRAVTYAIIRMGETGNFKNAYKLPMGLEEIMKKACANYVKAGIVDWLRFPCISDN